MAASNNPNPVEEFHQLHQSSAFVFLVYYRGHWCPFCIAYLKELVAISDEVKAAGGVIAAATAEAPKHLDKVRSSAGFSDKVIVDPENSLAKHLKNKELLDVVISDSQLYRLRGYKHGMAQPALLVLKNDGTVLQRWAIVPSLMNIGGATDRPVVAEVWKNVEKQLQGEDVVTKQEYTTTGVLHPFRRKASGK
ncbi:uncharacterized protein B0H64DRAFT_181107 [Chaetomium fimeti]|uniref:Alkyl hydroperoxide reductase subunit C/ Thiol specific antioxidant domain-containing protein n=1 Tax=Chaetomium fimeti TaxID=1854472 RepID=A0AAE0LQX5_9PEZI|nr:hypothetical protein B0H64DRAFT_181107 [Chaetomium fimeti]